MIKFKNSTLYLIMFAICIFSVENVNAQSLTQPRVLFSKSEMMKYISGKTLWNKNKQDRFYFSEDGNFFQQFIKSSDSYTAGEILNGTYFISPNNKLCWKYSDIAILDKPFCYQVVIGGDILKSWGDFDDPIQLYARGHNKDARPDFYWNRWNYSNLILNPEYVNILQEKLQKIKNLNLVNSEGSLLQIYSKDIAGKIMILPLGAVYHDHSGNAVFVDKNGVDSLVNASKEDRAKILKKITILEGKSYFSDDAHCWTFKDRDNVCQIVDIDGKQSLLAPQKGYVHHMQDGFTRIIKQGNLIYLE